jgi:hypothetical protein
VYAGENQEMYPYLGPTSITKINAEDSNSPGSVMHDMFILVANGQVGSKQFICKSDPAATVGSSVPTNYTPNQNPAGASGTWCPVTSGNVAVSTTQQGFCYSYSFAFQYANNTTGSGSQYSLAAFWRNTVDAAVAICADMNPGAQPKTLGAGKPRNSQNHQGDGQNVGFGDGHADFSRTPMCGENLDNIYNSPFSAQTQKVDANGTSNVYVTGGGNVQGQFDTDLSPAITDSNSYTRGTVN